MRKILFICLALGAGEYAAAQVPTLAECWPVFAGAAVLVALLGYGAAVAGWPYLAVALAGAVLFLSASTESERLFREQPWMRGRRRYEQRQGGWTQAGAGARRELSRRAALGMEHDPAMVALNRAILLGERRRLPAEVRKVFVESGTMHIFAISGLHVMAVARVLIGLTAMLMVPRRMAGAVAIPLLWGYVFVIGWSPSAVRAALMATFYFSAPMFWRRPDGITAWSLTFLAVHIFDPLMITNVGSALSFVVTLSILLAGIWGRGLSGWRAMLWMTVAAWAAGVPIAARVFGRVTPGGILANLVLVTAAGGAVAAGVTGIAVSFVSATAAAHLNNLSALFTRLMVWVSEIVAELPFSNFEVGQWSLLQCAAWYSAAASILWLLHRLRSRRLF